MDKFRRSVCLNLAALLVFSLFYGIAPVGFQGGIAHAVGEPPHTLVIDDFERIDDFIPDGSGVKSVNSLKGNYYGNGTQYCNGSMLEVDGSNTTWINMNLSNAYPANLDSTSYTDLVFVIKGKFANDKVVVTLSDGNEKTGTPYAINLATEWQTLKIPLDTLDSEELDLSKLNQIRFSQFSGTLYMEEMRFVGTRNSGGPGDGSVKTKVVANFNDASKYPYSGQQHDEQYGLKGTNELGGRLTSDGIQTCRGGILSVNAGTTWLCLDLSAAWPANFDSSPYTELIFVARGVSDNAKIDIEFTNENSVHSSKQTIKLTNEWQTYKIPLKDFTGVDTTKLNQIYTYGFDGAFEIDELRFEGAALLELLVDDFSNALRYSNAYNSKYNDARGTNSLGGGYYGDGIQVADGKLLSVEYTTNWSTALTGASQEPIDVTKYSHLVYNIKGLNNTSMDIAITFKDSSGNEKASNYVHIPVTTEWKKVKVPLSSFSGIDRTKLLSIKHAFANGLIYIDNISFEYDRDNSSNTEITAVPNIGPATSKNITDMDFPPAAPEGTVHNLVHTDAPVNNPLKGFMPFTKNELYDPSTVDMGYPFENFAHSMEWFYLPLCSTLKGMDTYDFSYLEKMLDQVAGTGRQSVFRFYMDYPDKPSGIPQFLLDMGLKTYSYSDFNNGVHYASVIPDYNDPNLMKALQNFIAEFGKRYDGDPRIGFIGVGIIGFWGEWHTWPYDGYTKPENRMPSTENQNKVLYAFDQAFNKTKVVLRYPMADSANLDLGYHDDSFGWESLDATDDPVNGQSWMTMGRLKSAGVENYWKTNPVGGEIRPEIQTKIWSHEVPVFQYPDDDPNNTLGLGRNGQDFYTCLNRIHASWLTQHLIFVNPLTDVEKSRILEAQSNMGYILHVTKAYISDVTQGAPLQVGIEMENTGVAPFYYNASSGWPVQIGLRSGNMIVKTWNTAWDITKVLPGSRKVFTWRVSEPDVPSNNYDVVMRVKNPLSNLAGDKALKVMFANEEQGTDGWLKLATVKIETSCQEGTPDTIKTADKGTVSIDGSGRVKINGILSNAPDASGTAVAAVSSDLLKEALKLGNADEKNMKKVEIALPGVEGAAAYKLELPAEFLASSAERAAATAGFEIKTDIATLFVPNNMLTPSDANTAGKAALNIASVDSNRLNLGLRAQIGLNKVIELALEVDGAVREWNNPDAPVTVSIPYKPTAAELANPEHITVWYIDSKGKALPVPAAKYDSASGTVYFQVTHFSKYAIGFSVKTFKDAAGHSWAGKAIGVMASKGVIKGTSSDYYSPDSPVKKADFILLLVKALGLTARTDGSFLDVPADAYYAEAAAIAGKLGITTETEPGKFNPEVYISRQDMFVITNRAMSAAGRKLPVEAGFKLSGFADGGTVALYAYESTAALFRNGIIIGDGSCINPLENATRAEAAVIIYRVCSR